MSKMDEIFRKQLQNRQEAVPDHLWSGIERQLREVPKRRVLPFYALTSIGVVALVAIGIYLMSPSPSADQQTSQTTASLDSEVLAQPNTQGDNNPADVTTSNISTVDLSLADNATASKVASKSTATVSQTNAKQGIVSNDNESALSTEQDRSTASVTPADQASATSSATINTANNTTVSTSANGSNDLVESKVTSAKPQSSAKSRTSSQVAAAANNTDDGSGDQVLASATTDGKSRGTDGVERLEDINSTINTSSSTNTTKPQGEGIQWLIEQTDNVTVNTISAPEIMKSEAFNRRRELYRTPEEIASIIELNTIETEVDFLTSVKAKATAAYTECPSFSKDHSGLFVDLYMSHDLPFRDLSARTSADEQLRNLRAETESARYSYGFGGRLSLRMPAGWSVRTGLHYTQINEFMTFMDENSVTYDFNNSYRMFDLPLMIGKDFGADGSRLYFSLNTGILLNMTFGQDATILDESGMAVDASDAADEQKSAYTDNVGISLYAGGAAYFRMTDAVDVFAEPYLRFLPGSLTSDIYGLEHRYSFVGINTGLRVRF